MNNPRCIWLILPFGLTFARKWINLKCLKGSELKLQVAIVKNRFFLVNGRDAMAVHSWGIYLFFLFNNNHNALNQCIQPDWERISSYLPDMVRQLHLCTILSGNYAPYSVVPPVNVFVLAEGLYIHSSTVYDWLCIGFNMINLVGFCILFMNGDEPVQADQSFFFLLIRVISCPFWVAMKFDH